MHNAPVIFEGHIKKMSVFNKLEPCLLVLSQSQVYLFAQQRLKWKQHVRWMSALIKSTLSNEVVLVFPTSRDLRFVGLEPEKVLQL